MRYTQLGGRDDPSLEEGDQAFLGFRSRVQASSLPPGLTRYLENIRCDRGSARVRKGPKALATDVTLTNPAVILDFDLPADYPATIARTAGTARVTFTAVKPPAATTPVGAYVSIDGAVQTAYNGDFQITARGVTGADVDWVEYTVAGAPATPATGTITACINAPALFETTNDEVRGSCVFTSQGRVEGILFATTDRAFLYRFGVASAQIPYPAGEQVLSTDECALEQYLDRVYLFRGYQVADALAVTSITRAGTTVTVTTTLPHGRATNDWIYMAGGGAGELEYNGLFQVSVTGANTFTYICVGAPTTPAATPANYSARPCKAPLVWDGNTANPFAAVPNGSHPSIATTPTLIRMPPADWGIQFSRRMVLPFAREQLIAGDFSDANTYDKQYNQLRILPGGNDWLVGALPYQGLRAVILYRKSWHLVYFDTTNIVPVAVQEITRAFGCVARKTAVTYGDVVLCLSDLGVHGCRIDQQLNLIPLAAPLSEPIQDIIDGINWAAAGKAVAKVWNNRLYLAVPYGTSTRNNRVLVFNFLNRSSNVSLGEWESVDTFQGDFDVQDFHILDYAGQKRLHALTTFGFVFLLEQLEVDEWGNTAATIGTYPIAGKIFLRDFLLGTIERKKFVRSRLRTNLTLGDAFSVDFVARNPDGRTTVINYVAASSTDVAHAQRIPRLRGEAGTLEIITSSGRPELLGALLEATITDRANITRT